ncbi:MAG: hypothetical protein KDB03_15710 [Planctomycetales bacterium]|nr:hypothetical protein [Planctomycetales bacterium]
MTTSMRWRWFVLYVLALCESFAWGQQETGFIETYALSEDRRTALEQLIPGTEDYFFYHCLYYQTQDQLAEAQGILEQWKSKFGDTAAVNRMQARQYLLSYSQTPEATLQYLRNRLGIQLDHAPPSLDRVATIPTSLDPNLVATERWLRSAWQADRSLSLLSEQAMPWLLDKALEPGQLRTLLTRLKTADLPDVVKRIADELALKDSAGFGGLPIHERLTLEQLEQLLELRPELAGHDGFVRAYAARLLPVNGSSVADKQILREYLDRMLAWVRRLPNSQNSMKALILGNRLQFDLSEQRFDRQLFIEYLSLPRAANYYRAELSRRAGGSLAKLDYTLENSLVRPIGNDSQLVQRFLQHFFQSSEDTREFARFLEQQYLDQTLAETRILFGIGDENNWFSKLNSGQQRELVDRVELRFSPHNQMVYSSRDEVVLHLELKNVPQLLVKIYQLNPQGYYRAQNRPINTDIDLDGLVANTEITKSYELPSSRRHVESLELEQLSGAGVWVVDLLGGGQRSRAVIEKGELRPHEYMTTVGQVFKVFDEQAQLQMDAKLEFAGRVFETDEHGQIIVPFAESTVRREAIVSCGNFAVRHVFVHRAEEYELKAGFLLPRESLVATSRAPLVVQPRLTCNQKRVPLSAMEQVKLIIRCEDSEGIETTQTVSDVQINDGGEIVHEFLVPPRLQSVSVTLSGRVPRASTGDFAEVSTDQKIQCNGINATSQIGDFFLRQNEQGYRLFVLGRNGEPVARLPVTIQVFNRFIKNPQSTVVATNINGIIELGTLGDVTAITASAQAMQAMSFDLTQCLHNWPAELNAVKSQTISLPLNGDVRSPAEFSLLEIRLGKPVSSYQSSLKLSEGMLTIENLPEGDFALEDRQLGQHLTIRVADGNLDGNFVTGGRRELELTEYSPVSIRQMQIIDQKLTVDVNGADALTRVHVLAHVFRPEKLDSDAFRYQPRNPWEKLWQPHPSLFADSLRLDEEYSYVLQRQGIEKFPGNLLSLPSLLIAPWDLSETENSTQEAQAGDALPKSAAVPNPAKAEEPMDRSLLERAYVASADWKCYDFLDAANAVIWNAPVRDGQVQVELQQLTGIEALTIVVVHPTGTVSRQLFLPEAAIPTMDQRLPEAFDASEQLAQTQRVVLYRGGERLGLGDAKTRRVQAYNSLETVFQLYTAALGDGELEKFRPLMQWPELTDEEKKNQYNKLACHEINFFLFHHDRPFFDGVIRPILIHKIEKQLIDRWLLGEPLDQYDALWRIDKLNTLERILLARSLTQTRGGLERRLQSDLRAHPLNPTWRQQRFELALRGYAFLPDFQHDFDTDGIANGMGGYGGEGAGAAMGGGGYGGFGSSDGRPARGQARGRRAGANRGDAIVENEKLAEAFFAPQLRLGRAFEDAGVQAKLFRSLDATKEWAESQYYRMTLANQLPQIIAPNDFWLEYLRADQPQFLPQNLDLPCQNFHEALCALSVLDLPATAPAPTFEVADNQLFVRADQPAVLFVESIEPLAMASESDQIQTNILIGSDWYLIDPGTSQPKAVKNSQLLRMMPYRRQIVLSNPGSEIQRIDVLSQIPAGAIPLAGSKVTQSQTMELQPYSTSLVETDFYFPQAGEFQQYGAQISLQGTHMASTPTESLSVLEQPQVVDDRSWAYIADWGTNAEVLEFLSESNLEEIELSRIAFRLKDRSFYDTIQDFLTTNQKFDASLFAYGILHQDPAAIQEYLRHQADFVKEMGPVIRSELLDVRALPEDGYQILEYAPLVVPRAHQLGSKRLILNASLYDQYVQLLTAVAYQANPNEMQKLQLSYYMLLQNRITDALKWFERIDVDALGARIQYDYLDAYLAFYQCDYEHANAIARRYERLASPRWRQLFGAVSEQLNQRQEMLAGVRHERAIPTASDDAALKNLTGDREATLNRNARLQPSLEIDNRDLQVVVRHRNVEEIQIHYYIMDIELLFSRNPFVSQSSDQVPAIQPNFIQHKQLGGEGEIRLELPEQIRNKNVLLEIVGGGITRTTLVTANSFHLTVAEHYGRLEVSEGKSTIPLDGTYVKVYARHRGGEIKFYKDGYTDLRGYFDYVSLSTPDHDTVEKFSILVFHPLHGAVVREVLPPVR